VLPLEYNTPLSVEAIGGQDTGWTFKQDITAGNPLLIFKPQVFASGAWQVPFNAFNVGTDQLLVTYSATITPGMPWRMFNVSDELTSDGDPFRFWRGGVTI